MGKMHVFLSHIHEEKALALLVKELLEEKFLGMIDIFVSSDEVSNPAGRNWLDNITRELRECKVGLFLTSKQSIGRPWINFEAGAFWVRDIPTVPICHSGMAKDNLPLPFKLLTAINITEEEGIRLLFHTIARTLGGSVPQRNGLDKFIQDVQKFENDYMYWDVINRDTTELLKYVPSVFTLLDQEENREITINKEYADVITKLVNNSLSSLGLLIIEKCGMSLMGDMEWYLGIKFHKGSRFDEVIRDSRFAYHL